MLRRLRIYCQLRRADGEDDENDGDDDEDDGEEDKGERLHVGGK